MGDLPEYMVSPSHLSDLCIRVLGSVCDSVVGPTHAPGLPLTNDAKGLLNLAGPRCTQEFRPKRNARPVLGLRMLMLSAQKARH
jgi:hypothetical protein